MQFDQIIRSLMGPDVLIAEDEPYLADILQMHLENLGYRVTVARDGQEACHILDASAPAKCWILLTDVRMPVMDGVELLMAVKTSTWPVAGIIVSTSLAEWEPDYKNAHLIAASTGLPYRLLPKPFSSDALNAAVGDVRQRASAQEGKV